MKVRMLIIIFFLQMCNSEAKKTGASRVFYRRVHIGFPKAGKE